jgi:hypothetical protein
MYTPPRRSGWGMLAALALIGAVIAVLGTQTAYFARTGANDATRIEFTVEVRNYRHELDDAAASLWYTCVAVVNWDSASQPRRIDDNRYTATITPSLGEDQRRRFHGCFEDGTIDKVRGNVVVMDGIDFPPDTSAATE